MDTRERILRTAARMLQTRGFNAFSFGHVAAELSVKPAAIHYHFPSKTDLGVSLIERYRERYQVLMEDAAAFPPRERLEGYFSIFERFARDGRVCFEGVLEAEFNAVPAEMQKALRRMVAEVQEWLRGVLEEGRERKEIAFPGRAPDKAAQIASTMQGGLQGARIHGKGFFDASLRQIRMELGW